MNLYLCQTLILSRSFCYHFRLNVVDNDDVYPGMRQGHSVPRAFLFQCSFDLTAVSTTNFLNRRSVAFVTVVVKHPVCFFNQTNGRLQWANA